MVNIIKGRTNADFFLEVALVLVALESTNLLAVEPYAFVPLAGVRTNSWTIRSG